MRPTVAIYGVADIGRPARPTYAHDHGVTVMEGGRVVAHFELERLTRAKQDNRLPEYFAGLVEDGILALPEAFDLVFVNIAHAQSFVSDCGRYRIEADEPDRLHGDLLPARVTWPETGAGVPHDVFLCQHELAHVATILPFAGAFPEQALLVHFDGGASKSNFSAFRCEDPDGPIEPLEWHWDLVEIAELFSANPVSARVLGLPEWEHLSIGGKLMGLASYGRPNPALAEYIVRTGLARRDCDARDALLEEARRAFGYDRPVDGPASRLSQDIAYVFQEMFERSLLERLAALKERTQARHLVLSGGCALNINANSRILDSGLFETLSIPPCCNDSGLSLGAAALLERRKHGRIEPHPPYLNGMREGARARQDEPSAALVDELCGLLSAGRIVGVHQGLGEVGPRALGNRSILAAPSAANRDRVSIECKRREAYRPVAPIVLEAAARQLFATDHFPDPADYMLLSYEVADAWRAKAAGIVHVDGTARPQILRRREANPLMHDLLTRLWEAEAMPCLINTSFNQAGEPIVQTAEQALASGRQMGLDAVLADGRLRHL